MASYDGLGELLSEIEVSGASADEPSERKHFA